MKTPAMRTIAIAMGLLILADGAVLAQGSNMSSDSTAQGGKKRRQPRPSDLPKAEQADESSSMGNMSKEDRELDRKIKSICRGC
ncbi:hypothetical protein [Bradyrhizobium sp. USDA 4353]